MKKQWTDLVGLAVVVSEEERPLGVLNGTFLHPETGQLIGFLVGYTKVLVSAEIEKWHSDYVKVRDADSLSSPMDILRIRDYGLRRTFLNGKRVRSKNGKTLGRVRDFCFDTATSSLLTFEVSKKFLWITWADRLFSYKDIEEITDNAIILNVEPEKKAMVRVQVPLPT
ncbi:MAG: PRC-barrel domain-containing protein [Patescibacteria group bacterium]